MATCEFSGTCSFFKEEFEGIPHIANLLRKAFCHSHFTTCVRYKIALSKGIDDVPHDLLPDGLKGSSAERRQASRQDKKLTGLVVLEGSYRLVGGGHIEP